MNSKIIISTLIGCLLGATVGYSASVVSLPHTFKAGTPIKASEVNANFSALSQEIAQIKNPVNLSKSSDFSEVVITPTSAVVDSTVIVGSTSFTIKEKVGVQDIITGKKYTLHYPVLTTTGKNTASFKASNCGQMAVENLVLRAANHDSKFTSYVALYSNYREDLPLDTATTIIYVQLSANLCAYVPLEQSVFTQQAISPLINRAVELQKYIKVQET